MSYLIEVNCSEPSPSVSVPCLGLCVTSIRYFAFQRNLEFGKTKDRSRSNYHFQYLKPLEPQLINPMLGCNKLDCEMSYLIEVNCSEPSPSVSVPCLGLCVTSIRYFAFRRNLESGKTKDRSRSNYHFQDLKPLAPQLINLFNVRP
jgi:hypothetical protein